MEILANATLTKCSIFNHKSPVVGNMVLSIHFQILVADIYEWICKITRQKKLCRYSLKWEIIPDYLSGPNLTMWVLKSQEFSLAGFREIFEAWEDFKPPWLTWRWGAKDLSHMEMNSAGTSLGVDSLPRPPGKSLAGQHFISALWDPKQSIKPTSQLIYRTVR